MTKKNYKFPFIQKLMDDSSIIILMKGQFMRLEDLSIIFQDRQAGELGQGIGP